MDSRKDGPNVKRNERGHSLLELSVAIALIAVFAAMAVPQLASAGTRFRERAAVAEFAAELRTARMLALTRRIRVDAYIAPDGRSVTLTAAGDPEAVLRTYPLPQGSLTVEGWPSERTIRFQPSGRSASPATIVLRGHQGSRWEITVSIAGRVSVT